LGPRGACAFRLAHFAKDENQQYAMIVNSTAVNSRIDRVSFHVLSSSLSLVADGVERNGAEAAPDRS